MKYLIKYRTYPSSEDCYTHLQEPYREIEAQAFVFKNGFVNIWTSCNETPIPDIRVNSKDVLTIAQID